MGPVLIFYLTEATVSGLHYSQVSSIKKLADHLKLEAQSSKLKER